MIPSADVFAWMREYNIPEPNWAEVDTVEAMNYGGFDGPSDGWLPIPGQFGAYYRFVMRADTATPLAYMDEVYPLTTQWWESVQQRLSPSSPKRDKPPTDSQSGGVDWRHPYERDVDWGQA